MLKLLYKTLLISILSGSLSIMNMTALAQSSSADAASSSLATTGSDGVTTVRETKKFDGVDQNDLLSSVTMIAIGAISARMAFNYKPSTTDVMIAAAGGAAYIAGEVYSNLKNKKSLDEMTKEITTRTDGKKDQAQIDSLVELRKTYQDAKETTETKKMLQTAAAVAFSGASALATYYAFEEKSMEAACTGAIASANSALAACVEQGATVTGATEAAACGKCEVELSKYLAEFKALGVTEQVQGTSSVVTGEAAQKIGRELKKNLPCVAAAGAQAKTIASGVTAACQPALTFKDLIHTQGEPKKGLDNNQSLNKILFGGKKYIVDYNDFQSKESVSVLDYAFNLFMPKAQASWMPLMGLGAAALASYNLVSGPLAAAIDTQMYVPLRRAIVFGVLGGLSYASANASQTQVEKIQSNIEKIDLILKELNKQEKGVATSKVQEVAVKPMSIGNNLNNLPALDLSNNPNTVKTDCIVSSGSSSCKSLETQMTTMPDFASLPDSLKSIGTQAAKLGDGLSATGSISGSTQLEAASLGAKQSAVARILAKTQEKLNNHLAKRGIGTIDFGAEQKKLLSGLNAKAASVLKSKGLSAGSLLSSFRGTPISGASQAVEDMAKKSSITKSDGNGSGAPGSATREAKDKDLDYNFKETVANPAAVAEAKEESVNNEGYDVGTNDISTNSGESIFKLISNRYLKSGYPKLFEEIPTNKIKK